MRKNTDVIMDNVVMFNSHREGNDNILEVVTRNLHININVKDFKFDDLIISGRLKAETFVFDPGKDLPVAEEAEPRKAQLENDKLEKVNKVVSKEKIERKHLEVMNLTNILLSHDTSFTSHQLFAGLIDRGVPLSAFVNSENFDTDVELGDAKPNESTNVLVAYAHLVLPKKNVHQFAEGYLSDVLLQHANKIFNAQKNKDENHKRIYLLQRMIVLDAKRVHDRLINAFELLFIAHLGKILKLDNDRNVVLRDLKE